MKGRVDTFKYVSKGLGGYFLQTGMEMCVSIFIYIFFFIILNLSSLCNTLQKGIFNRSFLMINHKYALKKKLIFKKK